MTSAALAPLPRAPSLPLFGSSLHYLRDPLGFLQRTAGEKGDLVEMRFINQKAWLVSDPTLIDQVLVKLPHSFQKDLFLRELKRVLGEGLLTSEGDFWKRQRRLIQPAFHRERIAGYAKIMVDHAARMADRWRDGERVDLHHAMMDTTADIVVRSLFGSDAGDTREVAACIEAMMERFSDPLYLLVPLVDRLPTAANRKLREVAPRLDRIVRGFIERRRALGADAPDNDLLAMLLAAQDDDGARMNDQQVRDEVLILYLAGHETTALALSWTFHLLSQHPAAEERLHAELRRVLGDRDPTFEDLPRLEYTTRVVKETLRMYPPAWAMGREATAPFELAGRRFEKGAWMWMIPWVVHHDPRWYPDPWRFDPDRWEEARAKGLPKFAYFPFGGGQRICIGNQFAMMEAVLMLATIARRVRLRAIPGFPVVAEPAITLRFKHGLEMTVAHHPKD
jgi:cytochrome P450